jgi:hypothetical protein
MEEAEPLQFFSKKTTDMLQYGRSIIMIERPILYTLTYLNTGGAKAHPSTRIYPPFPMSITTYYQQIRGTKYAILPLAAQAARPLRGGV